MTPNQIREQSIKNTKREGRAEIEVR